jgi:O-antigen/teichoic acid export membrane protein
MTKAGNIAKVSAKGGYSLLLGLVISTVISSIGTIFIAKLLGSDQYGLFAIVLTLPNLLVLFRDWSVTSAIVRFTAQFRTENRENEIRSVYVAGLTFEIFTGLILSIFSLLFSDFLSVHLFHRPALAPLIEIASFSILANALIASATAFFTGYEKMGFNSIMIICQSIIKTVLIIGLVLLGLGTSGATIGFTAGTIIASSIGIVLTWLIYRQLPKLPPNKLEIKAYLSTMLKYCLPLSLAAMIGGFLPQFYAFLLPIYYAIDNAVIGNYGVASAFVVLIGFFATPILTMMFPAFSKMDPEKDKEPLRNIYKFSIKYASLLVVPVTALVMCLAQPAVETLFGNTYSTAPLFLALLAIPFSYAALGYLSIDALLNGQGQSRYVLKMAIVTGAIGFPFGYILIFNFGVLGLIAASLLSDLPSTIMGLRFIKKNYGAQVDWRSSAKILISSAIPATLTYFFVMQLPLASWIRLIIGFTFFVIILVPAILLSRAIDRNDIKNLRDMITSVGIGGKMLAIFLNFIEKLMNTLKL